MTTMSLLSPPGTPAGPRLLSWTYDEVHRFGDLGVAEGRRAILIDGVILEEGPMSPPHAITLELVEEAIRAAFGQGWRSRCQLPLVLGQDLDPEPDFAVIAGGAADRLRAPDDGGPGHRSRGLFPAVRHQPQTVAVRHSQYPRILGGRQRTLSARVTQSTRE